LEPDVIDLNNFEGDFVLFVKTRDGLLLGAYLQLVASIFSAISMRRENSASRRLHRYCFVENQPATPARTMSVSRISLQKKGDPLRGLTLSSYAQRFF
jgi:hypothetical protein